MTRERFISMSFNKEGTVACPMDQIEYIFPLECTAPHNPMVWKPLVMIPRLFLWGGWSQDLGEAAGGVFGSIATFSPSSKKNGLRCRGGSNRAGRGWIVARRHCSTKRCRGEIINLYRTRVLNDENRLCWCPVEGKSCCIPPPSKSYWYYEVFMYICSTCRRVDKMLELLIMRRNCRGNISWVFISMRRLLHHFVSHAGIIIWF